MWVQVPFLAPKKTRQVLPVLFFYVYDKDAGPENARKRVFTRVARADIEIADVKIQLRYKSISLFYIVLI